jgi:hypothetical protein
VKLTDYQRDGLLARLDRVWTMLRSCSICNAEDWGVSDRLVELRGHRGGATESDGPAPVVPLVAVTCNHCGHVVLFNAITLGLIDAATGRVADR